MSCCVGFGLFYCFIFLSMIESLLQIVFIAKQNKNGHRLYSKMKRDLNRNATRIP
uniref:Uncharacterized protein n=1 Tax=Anopheles quadriannulatus TaxID=34691 RepID=A0A182XT42_ANOQN